MLKVVIFLAFAGVSLQGKRQSLDEIVDTLLDTHFTFNDPDLTFSQAEFKEEDSQRTPENANLYVGQLTAGQARATKLRQIQKWQGLPVTGVFDRATSDKMKEHEHCTDSCAARNIVPGDEPVYKAREKPNKWRFQDRDFITWSVEQKTLPNGLDGTQFNELAQQIFCVWETAANIRFKEAYSDSDIRISFRQQNHASHHKDTDFPDKQGGVLAHAMLPPPQPSKGIFKTIANGVELPIDGDVHLDANEPWSLDPSDKDHHVAFTLLHEIGHALGLRHIGGNPYAVMGTSKSAVMKRTFDNRRPKLDQEDIDALTKLYGPNLGITSESCGGARGNDARILNFGVTPVKKLEPEIIRDEEIKTGMIANLIRSFKQMMMSIFVGS